MTSNVLPTTHQPLFSDAHLYAAWADDFKRYSNSSDDKVILERLQHWSERLTQTERTAEGAFVETFFKKTWGYSAAGEKARTEGHTCEPQYRLEGAGAGGGAGFADLALGLFDQTGVASTPQVLCEFKDIRSGLDKPQRRKGSDRSPVKQCADYLKSAHGSLFGHEPVQPNWGIVTDMNEFRLYWRRTMPAQYQRFVLRPSQGDRQIGLLSATVDGAFQRFCFSKMLHVDTLLSRGGPSQLERLLRSQWVRERKLEQEFYFEYREFRQEVFETLVRLNPRFRDKRELVRLTQLLLDRCLFILFCEDVGRVLDFPPNLLRDLLVRHSLDPDYDSDEEVVWLRIKKLFLAMAESGTFADQFINKFNGGLFRSEPRLEELHVPNRLFCAKSQGLNETTIGREKKTLLYFSATYQFGGAGRLERPSLDLYTLGRIFEQSITDLEKMEADAAGRPSITELSKRKRDGVYYTPEWVTSYVVEEVVGGKLRDLKVDVGLVDDGDFDDAVLHRYREDTSLVETKPKEFRPRRSRLSANSQRVAAYLGKLESFKTRLENLSIVDPACGSGAFLIQALERVVREREWIDSERARIEGHASLFSLDRERKFVLTRNIYGVDINPESVEITRLALWLHTAQPRQPLDSLDRNILCGNSLVGSHFMEVNADLPKKDLERINPFDWERSFSNVFARGGFDCVIGNPPYVKLQNLKKAEPLLADYLVSARKDDRPLYESTQTGNFDLYLPFIEKGLSVLGSAGRMGYIAPSVWAVNEYGLGLRRLILKTRQLDRWLDFKSFQVFDEATTYTALQFFQKEPTEGIRCLAAPDGDLVTRAWVDVSESIPYDSLQADAWLFMPPEERRLVMRLADACSTLERESKGIVVGLQTSADHVFHLKKVSDNRYLACPDGRDPFEVEIEDGVMRPLVSGADVKRYVEPRPEIYTLFPYEMDSGRARLLPEGEMRRRFPGGWKYLRQFEKLLRSRESGAFDDSQWYRFGRNQNIDKQHLPKLMLPRLTVRLAAAMDAKGVYALDNVDVNGVIAEDEATLLFLMGVINGRVANFVWRRISKPFQNDYRSANRQFVAPLPVPKVSGATKKKIAEKARSIQAAWTQRGLLVAQLRGHLNSEQMVDDRREFSWLFADLAESQIKGKHVGVAGRERVRRTREEYERRLAAHLDRIAAVLRPNCFVDVRCRNGELELLVDGRVAVGTFESPTDAEFIAMQWRQSVRGVVVTERTTAKQFLEPLLRLRTSGNRARRTRAIELDESIVSLERDIVAEEMALDEILYESYGLSDVERVLIEELG